MPSEAIQNSSISINETFIVSFLKYINNTILSEKLSEAIAQKKYNWQET